MNAIVTIPDATTDQLATQITLLSGQINAANDRRLKLIAEFDGRKGWSGGGAAQQYPGRIDTHLLPPGWRGKDCDHAMAVEGLLSHQSSGMISTLSP